MNSSALRESTLSDSPSNAAIRKRLKRIVRWFCVLAVIYIVGKLYNHHRYPYGWSHSCDKQLYMALRQYADDHDGHFPSGEPTPEACLSLLHAEPYYCDAHLLSGKTVVPEVAEERLSNGEKLTSESCGWHYVPDLNINDDPELALFWDKVPGLGHNGQRQNDGGRLVWFITGESEYIKPVDWPSFLERQKELRQRLEEQPRRESTVSEHTDL